MSKAHMVLWSSAPFLEFIPTQSSILDLSANLGTKVPLVKLGSTAIDLCRTPDKVQLDPKRQSVKSGKIDFVLNR